MAWISKTKRNLLENQKQFIQEDFIAKNRKLSYFGMPSGDIIDFEIWYEFLGNQVIAVEFDPNQADLLLNSISNSLRNSEEDPRRNIFGSFPLDDFYGPYEMDVNELILNIKENEEKTNKEILKFKLKYPFDIISLGYTQFFSLNHKIAFVNLLEAHKRKFDKSQNPEFKEFLLFYSVNAQRTNNEADKAEIDNLVTDAKGWSIHPDNTAAELFFWLQEEGLIRDKLIVALPYFIMRESFKLRFDPEPLGIYLWQTEAKNNYFICVAFRFSHLERDFSGVPNEKLARIPIKDVKLVTDDGITNYETNMPEFRINDPKNRE